MSVIDLKNPPQHVVVPNFWDVGFAEAMTQNTGMDQAWRTNTQLALKYHALMQTYNQQVMEKGGVDKLPTNVILPQVPFAMNADGTWSKTDTVCEADAIYVNTSPTALPVIAAPVAINFNEFVIAALNSLGQSMAQVKAKLGIQ